MDDTRDEEDVLMIYISLKCAIYFCKSRSPEDDFSSKFGCGRASDSEFPTCVTCIVSLHQPMAATYQINDDDDDDYKSSLPFNYLCVTIVTR